MSQLVRWRAGGKQASFLDRAFQLRCRSLKACVSDLSDLSDQSDQSDQSGTRRGIVGEFYFFEDRCDIWDIRDLWDADEA